MRDTTDVAVFYAENHTELQGFIRGVRGIYDRDRVADVTQTWYSNALVYRTLDKWDSTGGASFSTFVGNSVDWVIKDETPARAYADDLIPDERGQAEDEANRRISDFRAYLLRHGGGDMTAILNARLEGRGAGPNTWASQTYHRLKRRFLKDEEGR